MTVGERRSDDVFSVSKRDLGGKGFSDGVGYNAVRPDYPGEAMSFFASTFGLDGTVKALDLGAGSGIFTRQIRDLVGEVIAVDPSDSMREAFEKETPDLEVLNGSDIAIPLEDASVDVVFVAQAFHWFDSMRALQEIRRVLRTGGGLGLIWNERDESVPWVRDLGVAMRWDDFQPYETGRDFSEVLAAGPFVDVQRATFRHAQTLTKEGLYQRVLTTSYVSLMNEAQREEVLRDVAQVVEPLDEMLTLPYVTDVYRATAS
ncbi:MAG TPA: class I SAM-dependent methyltransferase [Acidimicrobiales bacterium]|nr:class I SAM-dependent methyltransferase [Acidimicrobiales bacterium]